jgi:hypothetical protein
VRVHAETLQEVAMSETVRKTEKIDYKKYEVFAGYSTLSLFQVFCGFSHTLL